MNQSEKRRYLIHELIREVPRWKDADVPSDAGEQRQLLRSLMNVRHAAPITEEFERIQDEYLQEVNRERGLVTESDWEEKGNGLYLWQGDITRLKVGAIVNAANSGMTGCYSPCHNCIDNCIHTYAGIQLRNYCQHQMDEMARERGGYYEEPTGQARITPAFNLPCDYVIHTVGPIVRGALTKKDETLLASCYEACMQTADAHAVGSIAFCCISTGVFMFPDKRAAEIAVSTVKQYKERTGSDLQVIFNVFLDKDRKIYEQILK